MEKKATPFIVFSLVIVGLFAILVFARLNKSTLSSADLYNEVSPSAELVLDFDDSANYLFSSSTCPHCAKVAEFMDEHPETASLSGIIKVSLDSALTQTSYQNQLTKYATLCGLSANNNEVGIPLLYLGTPGLGDSERCLTGDAAIIAHLESLRSANSD